MNQNENQNKEKEIEINNLHKAYNQANQTIKFAKLPALHDHQHPFYISCPATYTDYFHIVMSDIDLANLTLDVELDIRYIFNQDQYKIYHEKDSLYEFVFIAEPKHCRFYIKGLPDKITKRNEKYLTKVVFRYYQGYLLMLIYAEADKGTYGFEYGEVSFVSIKLLKIPYVQSDESFNSYLKLGNYQTLSNKETIEILKVWTNESILENL